MNRVVISVLLLVTLGTFAPNGRGEEEVDREAKRARFAYFTSKLEPVIEIDPEGNAGQALAIYEAWARRAEAGDAMDTRTMGKIYAAAGQGSKAFKTVAHLIKDGKISNDHSVAMAMTRENAIQALINRIGQENDWRIARSDSGNVTSGMKSDLDQTIYIFQPKRDEHGDFVFDEEGVKQYERAPDLDEVFIKEFNRSWDVELAPLGISREALDVASIEGKNRFPDPRQVLGTGFWSESRRVAVALRNTPGAYTYAGAVGAQMQFRAMDAILDQNERAYMIFGPDADGEWGFRGTDANEGVRVMFGAEPELRPGYAFDAAIANFLELQHYMDADKFETKYHLRTWEDSLHSLLLVAGGKERTDKEDLIKLDPAERRRLVDESLEKLFPGDPERQALHAEAMEISAKQRIAHKQEIALPDAELFEGFGRKVVENWTGSAADIETARRRYRQVASEFCLESAYHASGESLALLVGDDPGKRLHLDKYRKIMGYEGRPDAEWEGVKRRMQDAAHLTFLFGIYDLGFERGRELMSRLARRHGLRTAPYLFGLFLRGSVQGIESHLREPGRYAAIYRDLAGQATAAVGRRLEQHVLGELGFEYEPRLNEITGKLDAQGLVWKPGKVFASLAFDPGNLDALAQILRVHIESEGDPDAVYAAIVDEFILAIPVAGQMVGASRGGVGGLIVMGAAMAVPQLGAVLLVVSLGQAGYAIYDAEVARPLAGQVENAVYRGFTGPELRYYDQVPEKFTKANAKELQGYRERLATNRPPAHFTPPYTYDLATLNRARDEFAAKHEAYGQLVAELQPKIGALQAKKSVWERYLKDPAAGGFFWGAGARNEQAVFEPSLLQAIEPVVMFSPYDLVDFRVESEPGAVEALDRELEQAATIAECIRAEQAWRFAVKRRKDAERARAYLERATGRRVVGDPERKADPPTSPELRHKIRRDSLYPGLLALGYDDPDRYFDDWLAAHPKLPAALVGVGLLENDEGLEWEPAFPQPKPVFTKRSGLPEEVKERLRARLRSDFQRSKLLFEQAEEISKNRERKAQQDLDRRQAAAEGAAAAVAVQRLRGDPELQKLYEAIREFVEDPDAVAPVFSATVYRTEDGFDCGFTLRADPVVYPPPYRVELQAFGERSAWRAAERGRAGKHPLTPSAQRAIKDLLGPREPKEDTDEFNLFVVTAIDAMGDVAGQALSVLQEEPPEEFGYFVTVDGERERGGVLAAVKQRFPEAANRLQLGLSGSTIRSGSRKVGVLVLAVDYRLIEKLIEGGDGESIPVDRAIGVYGDDYRGTITHRGTAQHVLGGKIALGSQVPFVVAMLSGLQTGVNRVELDFELENGARIRRTVGLHAKVTPYHDPPEERRERLDFLRERHESDPKFWHLRDLIASLTSEASILLYEGGEPGRALALAREAAGLLPGLPGLHDSDGGEPYSSSAMMKWTDRIIDICERISSGTAYTLATQALKIGLSLPRDEGTAGAEANCELRLYKLALRTTGSLVQSRPHLDRYLAVAPHLRDEQARKTTFERMWPVGDFLK